MRAAQRAFFETALAGETQAAARPPAAPASAAAQATSAAARAPAPLVERRPAADAAAPTRPLRPGSLLDIRV